MIFFFIKKYLPKINEWLHYRILDVSTLKIIHLIHFKNEPIKKNKKHRAMDDIFESINEFKFYFNRYFIKYDKI